MNRDRMQGFILAEFVIAVVFVGVVLSPLLLFVARIHDLNSAVGQQARREAWRSFTDQAVTAGIDPTRAPALTTALNLAVPAVPAQPVTTVTVPEAAGVPSIVPLRVVLDPTVPESRIAASGFQIGAGAVVAARTAPTPPLAPIVMPIPLVTPTDGTIIPIASLTPEANGAPYALPVQAASTGGTTVRATLNQPAGVFAGAGAAQFSVTAVDLMHGVNGVAWTEFSGDVAAGDRPVQLSDGRTRWLVTTSENRLQIYEPSPEISFAYRISLGAPIIVHAGVEVASNSTLNFDYAAYYRVQSGADLLQIDFPQSVKNALGSAWNAQSVGFQCTFHDTAGPFSGSLLPFFQPDTISLWADSVIVAASAIVPSGAVSDAATWDFVRMKSTLGTPVLSTTSDASGFYTAGTLQFTAPNGPDGSPEGRLSFQNGASLSTGTTLSITVVP